MTVEKMLAGQRSARNNIVVKALRDYGYIDDRGMGVRTKVVPAMKAGGTELVIDVTEDYVKSVLTKINGQHVLENAPLADNSIDISAKTVDKIVISGHNDSINDLLREQRDLSNAILEGPASDYPAPAEKIEVSEATVKRHIRKLKQEGILKRVGSKKTVTGG